MACQFCHVPYKQSSADLVVDNAVTGATVSYRTDAFLSADPLDPANADKSRWYLAFEHKTDQDGMPRLYPIKLLLSTWWGDWDDRGTPADFSDDVVAPIPLWRVRQVTQGAALAGVTDDNGDGIPEVNTLVEIALYIQTLQGIDSHGNQIAARPVLVRGGRVWYADAAASEGINSFDVEAVGCEAESFHPFSADHNVLPSAEALGANGACGNCHTALNGGQPTAVFDRLILVDPYDVNGSPAYRTVRDLTGVNPF
jgi:hypothetical protein